MHDVPSPIDTPTAGVSRRAVLKSGAAAGVVGLAGLPLLRVTETAVAASAPATGVAPGVAKRPGRLVLVFLRGAADHLSMTVPLDEANYQDARPGIAVDPTARCNSTTGSVSTRPCLGSTSATGPGSSLRWSLWATPPETAATLSPRSP